MADKCDEVLSIRLPHAVKNEYDQLSDTDKKTAKGLMLDALARHLWSKNHYDADFYFAHHE